MRNNNGRRRFYAPYGTLLKTIVTDPENPDKIYVEINHEVRFVYENGVYKGFYIP